MTRTSAKFLLLVWKNFTLKRRKPFSTLFELALPIVICLLACLIIGEVVKKSYREALIYNANNVEDATTLSRNDTILWSPCANLALTQVMTKVMAKLNIDGACVNSSKSLDHVLRYTADKPNFVVGVQFSDALSKQNNLDKVMEVKLRFPPEYRWFTYFKYLGEYSKNTDEEDSEGEPNYLYYGFLSLQYCISKEIMRSTNPKSDELNFPTIQLRRFPYPAREIYPIDKSSVILVFFLFLGFACIYSHVLRNISVEKERQIKEVMKIMGLTSWLHWASWYITTLLLSLIPIIATVALLKVQLLAETAVLRLTAPDVLFVFLLLFVSALITCAFAVSVFFSRSSIAITIGNIFFFVMYAPYFLTRRSSYANKLASCLLCGTAFPYGMEMITSYEANFANLTFGNVFEATSPDQVSMGLVMLMLILDSIIYLLIALYVDAIMPGEYGLSRVWYFPLTKQFWSGKVDPTPESMDDNFIRDINYYESEPPDAQIGIKILHLRKRYGKHKIVLRNLSMNMLEDAVTVLLGHNGAGKTTTMSILTGIQPPTGGTAIVNGYDIRTEMRQIRESLGFCPQDNVLFDDLTVQEHFYFYCKLKGMPKNQRVVLEIEKYLNVLDLKRKRHERCKKLSGGMKRRVCIGIALCASSKICILDEPTSGLDPIARRNIWDTIQAEKRGRTILLTTHFMNEADVLGDRIAILANGILKCYGTSFFLKKNYGSGYRLVISKSKQCNVTEITDLLKSYISEIHVETDVGTELTYILTETKVSTFESMLRNLEGNSARLGIESYGISLASMDDVFMKYLLGYSQYALSKAIFFFRVGAEYESIDDQQNIEKSQHDIQNKNYLTGCPLYMNQLLGVGIKKVLATRYSWILLLIHIILPILFMVLYMENLKKMLLYSSSEPELPFILDSYPNPITVVATEDPNNRYYTRYKEILNEENREYINWGTEDMVEKILAKRVENEINVRTNFLIGATFLKDGTIVAWFNGWAIHTPPLAIQYAINSVVKEKIGSDYSIQFSNHPAPVHMQPIGESHRGYRPQDAIFMPILMGLLIPYVTPFFVIFCVKEKACMFKHLQLVSGTAATAFWLAAFLWDFIIFMLMMFCVMIVMVIYKAAIAYGIFLVFVMAYGFASLPSMYILSLFFKRPAMAYALASVTIFFTGLCGYLALDLALLSTKMGKFFNTVCLCVPYYNFVNGVCNISYRYIMRDKCAGINLAMNLGINESMSPKPDGWNGACDISYYSGVSKNIIFLLIVGFVLFLLLLLCDTKSGYNLIWKCITSHIYSPHDEGTEDTDVLEEKDKVRSGEITKADYNVVLNDTTKYYYRLLAVNQLCLGVKEGECFGLVGLNGAGKTTTLKMLIGDETISKGDAWVFGQSLMGRLPRVRRCIGYCPQFNALYEDFTGKETLLIFCLLKGCRWKDCRRAIISSAYQFRLTRHLKKKVAYYSGGNKRKLNTAIALIGEPPVLFLDEPSTGMDPESKYHLWDTLCSIRDSGSTIVLITHYMEECEALCTRLAIMVNGAFQCLGSPQHIKSKFAHGYVLTIKVRRPLSGMSTTTADLEEVDKFVKINFPNSTVREAHDTVVTYVIRDVHVPWSKIFGIMERGKVAVKVIEDYSISQFDLEQIFLHFTKSQVVAKK